MLARSRTRNTGPSPHDLRMLPRNAGQRELKVGGPASADGEGKGLEERLLWSAPVGRIVFQPCGRRRALIEILRLHDVSRTDRSVDREDETAAQIRRSRAFDFTGLYDSSLSRPMSLS